MFCEIYSQILASFVVLLAGIVQESFYNLIVAGKSSWWCFEIFSSYDLFIYLSFGGDEEEVSLREFLGSAAAAMNQYDFLPFIQRSSSHILLCKCNVSGWPVFKQVKNVVGEGGLGAVGGGVTMIETNYMKLSKNE